MRSKLIAIAAVGVLLPACGGSGEQQTIEVWFHSAQGGERDVIERQVQSFNADSDDVQVELTFNPEGDYNRIVRAAADEGTLPCLLDFDGPFLTGYASDGLLEPLDTYLRDELRGDLLPSIVTQGTYEGTLYGVGTFDSGLALWGNRRLLDAAGARIPNGVDDAWTFEEFQTALRDLQALPEVDHALDLKFNYGPGEWFTYGFSPFVWGFGGALLADGRAAGAMDSEESIAALAWVADLIDEGIVDPDQEMDDAFYIQQTAGLSWVGHWMWEPHRDNLGDDLLLLPVPRFPRAQVTGLGSWQWGITTSCDAPDAAWTFLSFLLQRDEILRMTDANGAVPARLSAIAASDLYGPDGPLELFAEQLEGGIARARPVTPDYATVTEAFSGAVDAVRQGTDPTLALRDAAAMVDEVVAP